MWVFWILAGGLAAAAAVLVIARAASAARAAASGTEDPALPVYRRQLAELAELAGRGLLGPDEHQAARAESARRLLSAAETQRAPERPGGRATRLIVSLGAAGTAGLALVLYLILGSPGVGDQPYRARLKDWRNADPSTLDPQRMAAVLQGVTRDHPQDAQAYDFLGRAELAAGDAFAAAKAFRRAATLQPRHADLKTNLGEALMADGDGQVTPDARAAFQAALALDPRDASARYFLGRADIADGRAGAGLARWRALAIDLPAADPRRLSLLTDIERVATTGALAPPTGNAEAATAEGAAPAAGQMAFIRGMVAKQAADLAAHPDDPEGWARLVRAYGVLGDRAAQQQALASASRLFRDRPDALGRIEAQAGAAAQAAQAPLSLAPPQAR